jgi:dTDP-4-dehydrorhamnose reductase
VPYRETDPVQPLGVYGASKAAGEAAVREACAQHLIFRIAWVYGRRGKNFLRTMERLLAGDAPVRVVADQVGVPTWSRSVAEATAAILERVGATEGPDGTAAHGSLTGTYHLAGAGSCSWHGFAEAIARGLDLPSDRTVAAITTADYPTPARRPAYSVLDASRAARTFGVQLPPWEAQLARCLAA